MDYHIYPVNLNGENWIPEHIQYVRDFQDAAQSGKEGPAEAARAFYEYVLACAPGTGDDGVVSPAAAVQGFRNAVEWVGTIGGGCEGIRRSLGTIDPAARPAAVFKHLSEVCPHEAKAIDLTARKLANATGMYHEILSICGMRVLTF